MRFLTWCDAATACNDPSSSVPQFVLKAGDAKLSVRGSLLGEHQDASVLLTDFPMATLRPIFRQADAWQLVLAA